MYTEENYNCDGINKSLVNLLSVYAQYKNIYLNEMELGYDVEMSLSH